MIWKPLDTSCHTSFAVRSLWKKLKATSEEHEFKLVREMKETVVPKIFAMVFQRNFQRISIMSVLSNLETSLDIPTCAESSVIYLFATALNMIECLIGQFGNT